MSLKIPETEGALPNCERRDVRITRGDGKIAFEQRGVEAPTTWSDRAVEQAARIYFRTIGGRREDSVVGMVERVVLAIVRATREPNVGLPLVEGVEDENRLCHALTEMV